MPNWSDRATFGRWFSAMHAADRTRITLSNLKYDLTKKRISLRRFLKVLRRMVQAGMWSPNHIGSAEAELALDTFLNCSKASIFCQGPPVKPTSQMSFVIDSDSFSRYYVRSAPWAFVVDRKARIGNFEQLHPDHIYDDAMVRGTRPVAWATDSSELETEILPLTETTVADRVRDFLGLIFKTTDQHLLEVSYPPAVLQSLQLAAPTVLEGACVTVYRSNEGPNRWGNALDLEHLRAGGVEAVHSPIPFTAAFTVRYLGRVQADRIRSEHELAPVFQESWTDADDARVTELARKRTRRSTNL
jgi:hypothetical protein